MSWLVNSICKTTTSKYFLFHLFLIRISNKLMPSDTYDLCFALKKKNTETQLFMVFFVTLSMGEEKPYLMGSESSTSFLALAWLFTVFLLILLRYRPVTKKSRTLPMVTKSSPALLIVTHRYRYFNVTVTVLFFYGYLNRC